MEQIHTKVKAMRLFDCDTLEDMARHALAIVKQHCWVNFTTSWKSVQSMANRPVTEEEFFRNYLWCVYVSGFSAKAVTANYDKLLAAHGLVVNGHFIESAAAQPPSKDAVFKIWKNRAKFKAMVSTRQLVKMSGWLKFHRMFLEDKDPGAIHGISFMGPALSRHLARNLGNIHAVKPDLHLLRLAKKFRPEAATTEEPVEQATNLCAHVAAVCPSMATWPLGKVDMLLFYASATIRR